MSPGGNVLVASGDRLFAAAARGFLGQHGWNVVAVAPDGLQALAAAGRTEPDAVLVIPDLPRLGPAALARQIRRRRPSTTVVILGEAQAEEAIVLPADADAREILEALAAPPPSAASARGERPDGMAQLRTLTSRERLILKLLAEGVAVRDIAGRLDVSQHTVRTHMQNLYAKLGAHSRLDVVRFAAEHGLVGGEGERAAHES
jgi:DNA-binding NarL/FixJ family response regulator